MAYVPVSAMYPVGDAQWLMYPMGDKGGEENHCHVPSGGHSVGDTCTLVGDVPRGEERRRISAMYPVGDAQWLMYPVWGRGRRGVISAMYPVGDAQ